MPAVLVLMSRAEKAVSVDYDKIVSGQRADGEGTCLSSTMPHFPYLCSRLAGRIDRGRGTCSWLAGSFGYPFFTRSSALATVAKGRETRAIGKSKHKTVLQSSAASYGGRKMANESGASA